MDDGKVVGIADKKKRNPPPAPPTDKRPEIKIEEGQLPRAVQQSIEALAASGSICVYGNRLVVIHTTAKEEVGTITRPAGAARVHYVDGVLLTEMLTKVARFRKYDRRMDEERTINAPRRLGDHILARGTWPEFKQLDGIVETPTIWRGEIIDRPGYHLSSRLFLARLPDGYKPPPDLPSSRETEAAVDRLLDAVSTFPFETQADVSACVAGIITAVVRRSLPSAPAIAITANSPATGKSLLVRVMSVIATGRPPTLISLNGEEAEDEKRLGAGLLAGDQILSADNLEAAPAGSLLCSMLTEPSAAVRMLGSSILAPVPTNVCLMLNGNALVIEKDLRRRVLLIRLNAGIERPEERKFSRDAVQYVLERRGSLIHDILMIVKAYQIAGEPHVGIRPYGGFEQWDAVVRRPLVWLGLPDPLDPAEGLREIDPDLQACRTLFQVFVDIFGPRGATTAELIAAARKHNPRFDGDSEPAHPELREVLQFIATDRLDSRRLGWWLRRHRDRIIDGLSLRQGTDHHAKVAKWTVVECGVKRD